MHLRHQFWQQKSKDADFIQDIKKYPGLEKLIKYDKNFNNKYKISFESSLAWVIRNNPGCLHFSIIKVATSILPDFVNAFNQLSTSRLNQHFFNFFAENSDIHAEYTGTYDEKITSTSKNQKDFINWIIGVLSSKNEKDAYKQLLLIREYGNYFLRPYVHMPEFKDLNEGLGILIVPEGVGNETSKPIMRALWKKCNFDFRQSDITHSRISTKDRVRAKPTDCFGIFDDHAENKETKEMIPHKMTRHLPGKNLWRVTSTSAFTQNARYCLDMPLIASQGCSIALLLIPAIVIGKLTKEEIRYFNLNAISYMIGNGHHSFHEFSAAWEALEIPYVHGNYSSVFPKDLLQKHEDLRKLQRKFPDFLPSSFFYSFNLSFFNIKQAVAFADEHDRMFQMML